MRSAKYFLQILVGDAGLPGIIVIIAYLWIYLSIMLSALAVSCFNQRSNKHWMERDDYIKPHRTEGEPVIGREEHPPIKFGGARRVMARKTCKRCWGRGWIGFNLTTKEYEACSCVRHFAVKDMEQQLNS